VSVPCQVHSGQFAQRELSGMYLARYGHFEIDYCGGMRPFSPLVVAGLLAASGVSAQEPDGGSRTLQYDDLFPTDRILEVEVTLDKREWRKLRAHSRSFQMALSPGRKIGKFEKPFSYFEGSITIDGVTFPKVGIRKKGFLGSLSLTRPSLKVKLDHYVDGAAIDGLSKLTLNNNQQDASLASQYLTYALFRAGGVPAPRVAYVRLTVNGKYLGIYCNVESVRAPFLANHFGSSKGVLFEGAIVDFFDGWSLAFEPKRGNKERGIARIRQLVEVLENSDDATLEADIADIVDLDAFYKFWALEGLLGFWDGYSGNKNNFFLYLHPVTNLFHFMPWGADMAFTKYHPERRRDGSPISVHLAGRLPHRLYQLESGRKRYEQEIRRLLAGPWNEKELVAECHRLEELLEPHVGRQQRRMPDWIDDLRDFIEDRRGDILAEIENGMPVWTEKPDAPWTMGSDDQWQDTIWGAARDGDVNALQEHLAKGVDVDAKAPDSGVTALSLAATCGEVEAVQFLISKGADVDAKDGKGNAPLHGAAFLGHVECVVTLLASGANVNIVGEDGHTPLDSAAAPWSKELTGFVKFLEQLLHVEFDVAAIQAKRPVVAELLRRHGASSGH